MIDDDILYLIQAGLEGELGSDEQQQLQHTLANSAEARQYKAELEQLMTTLDQMPAAALPAGLEASILTQIGGNSNHRVTDIAAPPRQRLRQWLVPGSALAASISLAIGLSQVTLAPLGTSDMDLVSGTIVQPEAPVASNATASSINALDNPETNIGRYSTNVPGAHAEFALNRARQHLTLSIDIKSDAGVTASVQAPAQRFRFIAPSSTETQLPPSLTFVNSGLIHIKSQGNLQLDVELEPLPGTTTIDAKVVATDILQVTFTNASEIIDAIEIKIPDKRLIEK
jgi:hypothetical protein